MTDLEALATIEEDDTQENTIDKAFIEAYTKAVKEGAPFNLAALENGEKPVFIVADPDDAAALRYLGQVGVSVTKPENSYEVRQAIEKARKTLQGVIIALPEAFTEAAADIEKTLERFKIPYYTMPEDVDVIREQDKVTHALSALYGDFSGDCVGGENAAKAFEAEIEEMAARPPITTGHSKLDRVINGGLFPGLYTIGAEPGTGKTAFVMQIADHIAAGGRPVLVYALEMSKIQLKARSISRLTAEKKAPKDAATATEIMSRSPKEWPDVVKEATTEYFNKMKTLYIRESFAGTTAAQIEKDVRNFSLRYGEAPVVVVDYLQILAPVNEKATDKQNADAAVKTLKSISRTYKTPVIVISSWNRGAYETGGGMAAFKESGSIEYTSDVLASLQLKAVIDAVNGANKTEKEKAAQQARKEARKVPQRIAVVFSVHKNRFGQAEQEISFSFDAAHSLFREA